MQTELSGWRNVAGVNCDRPARVKEKVYKIVRFTIASEMLAILREGC